MTSGMSGSCSRFSGSSRPSATEATPSEPMLRTTPTRPLSASATAMPSYSRQSGPLLTPECTRMDVLRHLAAIFPFLNDRSNLLCTPLHSCSFAGVLLPPNQCTRGAGKLPRKQGLEIKLSETFQSMYKFPPGHTRWRLFAPPRNRTQACRHYSSLLLKQC